MLARLTVLDGQTDGTLSGSTDVPVQGVCIGVDAVEPALFLSVCWECRSTESCHGEQGLLVVEAENKSIGVEKQQNRSRKLSDG